MTELNSRAFSDSLYYERCSCLALLARLKNAKTPDLQGNGPEGVRHNTVVAAVYGRNNNDHVTAFDECSFRAIEYSKRWNTTVETCCWGNGGYVENGTTCRKPWYGNKIILQNTILIIFFEKIRNMSFVFYCLFGASRLSHLEAVLSSFRFRVVQKMSNFYWEFFEKFNLDRILFIFIHSLVMSFHIKSGPSVILRALRPKYSCGKTKIKGNVTFTILMKKLMDF